MSVYVGNFATGGTRTVAWGASFANDIATLPVSIASGQTYRVLLIRGASAWLCFSSNPVL